MILFHHVFKNPKSLFNRSTFHIHVYERISHKNIRLFTKLEPKSMLNNMTVCLPAKLQISKICRGIQQVPKGVVGRTNRFPL